MKHTYFTMKTHYFIRILVFATSFMPVGFYSQQMDLSGRDIEQTALIPPVSVKDRILRYNPGDLSPVTLNLFETRLFFGLSRIENDSVIAISSEEWEAFLEASVRPRFSSFTVINAMGDYQGLREGTKILIILHQGGNDEKKIHALVSEYIKRFDQDGVLRIDR